MLNSLLSKATSSIPLGAHKARHTSPGAVESVSDAPLARDQRRHSEIVPMRKHPVIGVLGAKGGVGATTLSINLAAAIARNYGNVTLVDANLQQPDAAILVGKSSDFTLLELMERSGEMTADIVNACSIPISTLVPGCRLVSPPVDGEAGIKTHLSALAGCLNEMRTCSPVWLLDLPRHLDRHLVTMLDQCDVIVLVSEPTLTSINATKRWSKVFEDLEYDRAKTCMALNRVGGKFSLVEDQARHFDLFEDVYSIPNAYELSERSVTRGEPVVTSHPKAAMSAAVVKLAEAVMGRFDHV